MEETQFMSRQIDVYDDNNNTVSLTSVSKEDCFLNVNGERIIEIKKENLLGYARMFQQFYNEAF